MNTALKAPFALVCCLTVASCNQPEAHNNVETPELVRIEAGVHQHRQAGEFLKNNLPVNAPLTTVQFKRPLHVSKYQVSRAQYSLCIADGVCDLTFRQKDRNSGLTDNRPVTGVSYTDAVTYAGWLSNKTGIQWRLPTDTEWAYAAGSRFFDDAKTIETDPNDPSKRMLSQYRQSVERDRNADPVIRPRGGFGANEKGVFDQSGNVWEWTTTCYQRSKITDTGEVIANGSGNCGVRVVEGRHRSYMTFFVKDAKAGGCAVGTPPDYLGFRLVRDDPKPFSMQRIRQWFTSI